MCKINPELYAKLSESRLVIFKGDLNYRKLIGDFSWACTESFVTCLRGKLMLRNFYSPSLNCNLSYRLSANEFCKLTNRKS